jgi:hypothetical protein
MELRTEADRDVARVGLMARNWAKLRKLQHEKIVK